MTPNLGMELVPGLHLYPHATLPIIECSTTLTYKLPTRGHISLATHLVAMSPRHRTHMYTHAIRACPNTKKTKNHVWLKAELRICNSHEAERLPGTREVRSKPIELCRELRW